MSALSTIGRAIVGVLGELLITCGVLILLFVGWQLWWTDVIADRAQAGIVAELQWAPPGEAELSGEQQRSADEPAPTLELAEGDVFATIYVPRFGKDYVKPIAEGIDKATVLDVVGVGHYPETQMPGELGNFAIAGHRTTYGKPFSQVDELEDGDAIVIRTQDTWFVYKVTSDLIVYPNQVGVLSPVPTQDTAMTPAPGDLTERYITLTSCHPRYWATERYIVHGTLAYWAPVADGTPAELAGVRMKED